VLWENEDEKEIMENANGKPTPYYDYHFYVMLLDTDLYLTVITINIVDSTENFFGFHFV